MTIHGQWKEESTPEKLLTGCKVMLIAGDSEYPVAYPVGDYGGQVICEVLNYIWITVGSVILLTHCVFFLNSWKYM